MQRILVSAMTLASCAGIALAGPPANTESPNAPAAPAQPADTNAEVQQLKSMVRDLQSQVDSLKAEDDAQWMTQERADQIRGLVQDVLADADTRASLLQSGATAGYDKGFFISGADGNYLLRVYGQLQIRYVYNWRDDNADDSNRSGFEVRRAKIGFKGNVFDPSWTYDLLIAADRSTGNVQAEDNMWIQKSFDNGLKLRVGQMKAPFTREEVLSSTRLFAVERTLVNSFFTAGTTQGIQAAYEAEKWRVAGMFDDGMRTQNTSWATEDTEYAFQGRFEYLAMGDDWKSNDQYDGFRGSNPGLVLGAAFEYQQSEYGTGNNLPAPDFNNNEVTTYGFTADATYLGNGWSASAAGFYRTLDPRTGSDLNQWGFFVRGGYFLAENWEIYAQYEWASADIDGVEDLSVATLGVNRYFDKHNLKWQTDLGYAFNAVASVFASEGSGWLADPDDGEVVFRTQFQLLF